MFLRGYVLQQLQAAVYTRPLSFMISLPTILSEESGRMWTVDAVCVSSRDGLHEWDVTLVFTSPPPVPRHPLMTPTRSLINWGAAELLALDINDIFEIDLIQERHIQATAATARLTSLSEADLREYLVLAQEEVALDEPKPPATVYHYRGGWVLPLPH